MHPLATWLKTRKMTQAEFCRRAGLKPGHLNDVLAGRSYLGRKRMLRVVEVTGGEVTIADLLTWEAAA